MSAGDPAGITSLLRAAAGGDSTAMETVIPLVYADLRRLAHHYMRSEHSGHVLQTTALVNEAWMRLITVKAPEYESRSHFLGLCAQLMRRILVDFARSNQSLKRGAAVRALSLDEALTISAEPDADLVALDQALIRLADTDERKARVVELRVFGGLSVQETAEVLEISAETVHRDWRFAKAWLMREMESGGS